jgi:hypothetical protein
MRWFAAVTVLGLASCSDATPIGFLECVGENTRCELPRYEKDELHDLDVERISSTDLATLEPTWNRRVEVPPDWTSPEPLSDLGLATGLTGEVWLFHVDGARVGIATLDADGEPVDEATLEPKSDVDERRVAATIRVLDSHAGPKLYVSWADERGSFSSSELVEFTSISESSRQSFIPGLGFFDADARGYWFGTGGNHPAIARYDRDGNLLWRQTGELSTEDSWEIRLRLDERGRVHALVTRDLGSGGPNELWRLDRDGNVERRHLIAFALGSSPELHVDAEDRSVVVSVERSGDLLVLRPETRHGVMVERHEYEPLSPRLSAVDRAGNIYVVTQAGGRALETKRTLLCRMDGAGNTRCLTLTSELNDELLHAFDLAVAEPGAVYIRTDISRSKVDRGEVDLGDSNLLRYDWPLD